VLIGTRLGIDGVNPVYYEAIKASPLQRQSHLTRYTAMFVLTSPSPPRRFTLGPSQLESRAAVHPPRTTSSALKRTTSSI